MYVKMLYNIFHKDMSANDCDIAAFLIFPIRNKYFIYQKPRKESPANKCQ